MRIFALSDIHVDYQKNLDWLAGLSCEEYLQDILILAGDVTDDFSLLKDSLGKLCECFFKVAYVPGNHELWIRNSDEAEFRDSWDKLERISELCTSLGVLTDFANFHKIENSTARCHHAVADYQCVQLVPFYSWYDFSFAELSRKLKLGWRDFSLCRWPENITAPEINQQFLALNEKVIESCSRANLVQGFEVNNTLRISYSHFLPRIDLMPTGIPENKRLVYPVLGSTLLDAQIRKVSPDIHVYGHSHVNRDLNVDGIRYVNNAFAYPAENRIARKALHCIYQTNHRYDLLT